MIRQAEFFSRLNGRAKRNVLAAAALGVVGFGASGFALVQDPRETVPPPAAKPVETGVDAPADPTTQPTSDDDTVVLDKLSAIELINTASATGDAAEGRGVRFAFDSVPNADQLRRELEMFLDRPLRVSDLQRIGNAINAHYRAQDRPFVQVSVPEQDVTDGTLRVLVLEGRAGEIEVDGTSDRAARAIKRQFRVEKGDRIRLTVLREELKWANKNPFRTVAITFEPGQNVGETDLRLTATDRFPLQVFSGFRNTGTPTTGDERLVLGFNTINPWLHDHQISYQVTSDAEFDHYRAHGLSYIAPLANRHTVTLFGTWARTEPMLPDPDLVSVGRSWLVSGRYSVPVKHSGWETEVHAGFDVARSNNNIEFGGEQVFDTSVDTIQLVVGGTMSRIDSRGQLDLRADAFLSPGNLTTANDRDAYEASRPGANPTYAYITAGLDRTTNVGNGLQLHNALAGQISSGPMRSSEQLGLVGTYAVRGFDEYAATGDVGFVLRSELLSPAMRPLTWLGETGANDELRLLTLLDLGWAANFDASDGYPDRSTAAGAGVGFRYRIGPYLSVDYAYAWQLLDADIDDDRSGRHHLSVNAMFRF